jgi:hypothetical protein
MTGNTGISKDLIGTTMFQNFDLAIARTGLTVASARANGFVPESVAITGLEKGMRSLKVIDVSPLADTCSAQFPEASMCPWKTCGVKGSP